MEAKFVQPPEPPQRPAASQRSEWAQAPERSNTTLLRIFVWISLKLGRPAARWILYCIAIYFLVLSPRERRAARDLWRHVRGTPPTLRELFGQFLSFASVIHDRVFLVSDQLDLFDIHLHGREVTVPMLAKGRGLMLMGAHMGSFEVLRTLGRDHHNMRVAMAMYQENAQRINNILQVINPNAGLDVVALGQVDSMLKLHALLDNNTIMGMMGDRILGGDVSRTLPFLGEPAPFPMGPFRMAAILRRPVVFMVGLYGGGNRYDVHFEQLADFSDLPAGGRQAAMDQAMVRYAQLLEKYARLSPSNWFNFYDFWQRGSAAREGAARESAS